MEQQIQKKISLEALLTLIPAIIVVTGLLSLTLATALEFALNRSGIYIVFVSISLFVLFLMPVPCLVLSIIGLVISIKKQNQQIKIFAILEIIGGVAWSVLAGYLLYIGQGV